MKILGKIIESWSINLRRLGLLLIVVILRIMPFLRGKFKPEKNWSKAKRRKEKC